MTRATRRTSPVGRPDRSPAADGPGLSPKVQAAICDLIEVNGGVSEAEARLLLMVIDRLEEIHAESGAAAAGAAAAEITRLWLEGAGTARQAAWLRSTVH